ncbi:hypothetical protein EMPS_08126 [Entomortierella parvispora]|uniref:Uncharacterized protein n=1 Tax=Entomortierella parvispora TaxID=205924 RepID=A0A9P3HG51_9FUNG|nr:hypothetical protein EMPS_08126 [Entomortierella parvispora]
MRFTIAAASVMALASTVMGADIWKNLGGDLAFVGPSYNATFKAGDTIPLEYTFYTLKSVSVNATNPSNATAPNMGTATLTSLAWIGATGNQTLQVTLDNDRSSEYSSPCLATDPCTGSYYPKRVNLVIPSDTYLSNYTIEIGYTLSIAGNYSIFYREPVTIVAATDNVTASGPVFPQAPQVQVTLPVFAAPKGSSAFSTRVPKAVMGAAAVVVSALLMF